MRIISLAGDLIAPQRDLPAQMRLSAQDAALFPIRLRSVVITVQLEILIDRRFPFGHLFGVNEVPVHLRDQELALLISVDDLRLDTDLFHPSDELGLHLLPELVPRLLRHIVLHLMGRGAPARPQVSYSRDIGI